MRVVPSLKWQLDTDPAHVVDDRLLPLLASIAKTASLMAAVADCGISYRAAWGLLREYEEKMGVALVLLERGRGATLTANGTQLLTANEAALQRLAQILPRLATQIGPRLRHASATKRPALRVAASHDLALASLSEALPAESGLRLELSFMGSLQALKEFAQGRADIAGFHVPIKGCATLARGPFLQFLRPQRDQLIRFVDRDQGLILRRANAAKVTSLADIAAKGLRFVNRQRGSGTRLIIDQLLQDSGIEPGNIIGYRTEEFTHAAVAATVASGGCEAGFGLRAAAAEYHLAFVPLVRERYFLAVRSRDLPSPSTAALLAVLRSAAFRAVTRQLAGYHGNSAGTVVDLDALDAARAT